MPEYAGGPEKQVQVVFIWGEGSNLLNAPFRPVSRLARANLG